VVWWRCAQSNAVLCCVAFKSACRRVPVVLELQMGEGKDCDMNAVATMIHFAHAALDVLAECWIEGNNGVGRCVGLKLPVPSSR
jgi:hypothetical protein